MLNWFKRKNNPEGLPEYTALRSLPALPPDLAEQEAGESFAAHRQMVAHSLGELPRPAEDKPLFVELLASNEGGILTITLPENGGQCLPIFSSFLRAADYIQTLLTTGPTVQYLSSSPLELVRMLRDLERMAGIKEIALDRCPRCSIFTTTGTASVNTPDDVIAIWSIWKATELARLDLYNEYARKSAHAGQLEIARDVALQTVGHVSLEDPRAHLLLGQVAVALKDRKLLTEAKGFLQYLGLEAWERKLDRTIQSGSPDFDNVD